ncbi:hypothetical protein JZ751_009028, partial [Albula glossodonta]
MAVRQDPALFSVASSRILFDLSPSKGGGNRGKVYSCQGRVRRSSIISAPDHPVKRGAQGQRGRGGAVVEQGGEGLNRELSHHAAELHGCSE